MKTVAANSNETDTDNDLSTELEIRMRARKIIERVFPNVVPDFRLIENITKLVVVADDDGIVEDDFDVDGETAFGTKTNVENLLAARSFAKAAYGDDSPSATVAAFEALYIDPSENEINDKLDEVLELLAKRKK